MLFGLGRACRVTRLPYLPMLLTFRILRTFLIRRLFLEPSLQLATTGRVPAAVRAPLPPRTRDATATGGTMTAVRKHFGPWR